MVLFCGLPNAILDTLTLDPAETLRSTVGNKRLIVRSVNLQVP